jgi:hypothetical protein
MVKIDVCLRKELQKFRYSGRSNSVNRSGGPIERVNPRNGKQRDDTIISPEMMRVAVCCEKRIAVKVING